MPDERDSLLLDTHVWIWLMEGHERLRPDVREAIQRAVPEQLLSVSAISVWEVAMLEARGRIVFDVDCTIWVSQALSAPGLSLTPLRPDIAVASTRLPGDFHGDPADRIIAATARQSGCTLITADEAILRYAESGHLRVLAAS